MVFKKDLIKLKKYKIDTSREEIKKLKWVKAIKMYKILTQIHLNWKWIRDRITLFCGFRYKLKQMTSCISLR